MQELINSGDVWKLEGSYDRLAMSMLESGACMLPEERHCNYYGNIVPIRNELKEGTKGTLGNCQRFWKMVENGEIIIDVTEDDND